MSGTTLRVASWAALVGGAVAAFAAATAAVIGILVFTGQTTYPVDAHVGPFTVHHEMSMPVALSADVCQLASVRNPKDPGDCLTFFAHDDSWPGDDPVRTQDADIRPMSAQLTGSVGLATTGGGSTFVAASIARTVIGLAAISAALLLSWRLLRSAGAGTLRRARAGSRVRAIGWLLVAGGLAQAALSLSTSATQLGYSFESFGSGPHLTPLGVDGAGFTQLALGALLLLLAEVFRHSVATEAETRPATVAD